MRKIHSTLMLRAARGRSIAACMAAALFGSGLSANAAEARPSSPTLSPKAAVDALNNLSGGRQASIRANHAQDVLAMGSLVLAKSVASPRNAPQFASGTSLPAKVRFFNGTGLPALPDLDPNASLHGIAIRFSLPHGVNTDTDTDTDTVNIASNKFPVATPEEFVGLGDAIGQSGVQAAKPTAADQFVSGQLLTLKWPIPPRPTRERGLSEAVAA